MEKVFIPGKVKHFGSINLFRFVPVLRKTSLFNVCFCIPWGKISKGDGQWFFDIDAQTRLAFGKAITGTDRFAKVPNRRYNMLLTVFGFGFVIFATTPDSEYGEMMSRKWT